MNVSELSEPARTKLDSIRQLWSEGRQMETFDHLPIEEELDSYVQVSLGDLGMMLKALQAGNQQHHDWHRQIEIAGRSAALLTLLVKAQAQQPSVKS